MGKSEKAAGNRFEKYLKDKFKSWGWKSDRVRSIGVTGEPDLYATKGPLILQIQAKETQRLSVSTTLMRLIDSIDGNEWDAWSIPIVVWKRVERRGKTGKRMQVGPVTVTLALEDFLELTRRHGQ